MNLLFYGWHHLSRALTPLRAHRHAGLPDHPHIKPKSIHSPEVMEGFGDKYLYLSCITFVKSVSARVQAAPWSCLLRCPPPPFAPS